MNSKALHFWVVGQEDVSSEGWDRHLYNLGGPNFRGSIRRWKTGYTVSYRPGVRARTYRHLVRVGLEVAPQQGRIDGKDRNQSKGISLDAGFANIL